ncbi:MAG: VWA domain-containing protein [Candidatus Nanohaloarchaea archaeon]
MLTALSNSALSNFFLDPSGLLALAALIPLIIFYLVRPKPDEKLMPSIRFFMKDEKEGKVQQALSKILQNLMLIFHMVFIASIAAAIANPYVEAPASSENVVIVFDNSASMNKEIDQAVKFAKRNLGEKNTLITVNQEVEVVKRKASRSEVKSALQDIKVKDTATDLASALETAQGFKGKIVVASDMDHSTDSREIRSKLEALSTNRKIELMNATSENSWGIVNLNAEKEWIEVKNYREEERKIAVKLGDTAEKVTIAPETVRKVNLDLKKGKNIVELPEDEMKADNKAYIYLPKNQKVETALISTGSPTGKPARYIYTALELINSTNPHFYEASPQLSKAPDADIYILQRPGELLPEAISSIEEKVENGDDMVVFATEGLKPQDFDSLPVRGLGELQTKSVELNNPRKVSIGNTEVFNATVTGTSLSDPEEALVHGEYGQGDVLFYNIDDKDFRTNLLYPVFWKEAIQKYTDIETVEELNIETGKTTTSRGQLIEFNEAGFHNVKGQTYAANLLNEDESSPNKALSLDLSGSQATTSKSIQNLSTLLVLLLALIELTYLWYIGDLK